MTRIVTRLMLACVVAGLASCGLDIVKFDVVEEGQVGLAGVNIPGLTNFGSSMRDALSTEGVNPGDVDSMHVLSGSIDMTSQGGITQDLSFFESLEFVVSAKGMQSRTLAVAPALTQGTRTAELEVDSELDLKPYLKAGDMTVEIVAVMNPVPADRVDLKIVFRVRVDVNVV